MAKDPITGVAKQNAKNLSPKDRQATFVHLAETGQYNAKHSLNHAKAVAKIADRLQRKYPGDKDLQTLIHNAQHTAKHAFDTSDHMDRLIDHFRTTYPGAAAAYRELMNPKPTDKPSPPGKVTKK